MGIKRFFAPSKTDLDGIESEVRSLLDDSSYYSRVKRDFGKKDKDDVFVQTGGFNMYLYEQGGVAYGVENIDKKEERLLDEIKNLYHEPAGGFPW